jgi:hypothetical protein
MSGIPFDAIQAAALAQANGLLREWFPRGRIVGREFKIGNLQGDNGDSLSVNITNGKWSDFATGEGGHDLIDLRAAITRADRVTAARELGETLGISLNGRARANGHARPNGHAKPKRDKWQPMIPLAPGAPKPDQHLFAGYSAVYEYCGTDDRVLFYVRRREATETDRKQFHPLVYGTLNGRTGWHSRHPPSPKPLYGLNRLTAFPDAPVLLCEGEKAANAAQELFPECACLSWCGGAKAARYTDVTPLAERDIIIWPDNDAEGLGAAAELAKLLPRARTLRVDDLPLGGDAADIWPDDPDAWLREHLPPEGEPPARRFPLIPFSDIKVARSAAYLVRGIIPREGIIVVWGPPKCGKTFWVLDLIMHVAVGREYRHRRVAQGSVVYVACEGERGIGARIEAWRQQNPLAVSKAVPFWLLTTRLDLASEHNTLISDVRAQIGSEHPVTIVIDTLNRSINGSESSDEDMGAYIRAADAIREAFRCAVIIVHHCGLDATRPRGHTSLLGAADAQIAVKRDAAGTVIVAVEYMKDGECGTEITSQLKVIDLGLDDDGEPITSCVIELSELPDHQQCANKVPPSARAALDLLSNAIATEGETPPASGHIPPNIRAVSTNAWRRYCYAGTISESDNQDAKQKAFVRAAKALQNARVIGTWNDWVWLA